MNHSVGQAGVDELDVSHASSMPMENMFMFIQVTKRPSEAKI